MSNVENTDLQDDTLVEYERATARYFLRLVETVVA